MGSLFGGTKKTTTVDEGPWKDQQPYVKDAMAASQNIFKDKLGSAAYDGERYAGIDPMTRDAVSGIGAYASGAGKAGADATGMAGLGLLGQNGNYMDQLGSYAGAAGADNTQTNIQNAGMYANNPYLDGQIDAASRDVTRNLQENTLTGIDRAATGSGNINSSRAGIADGIATRGAQDQIGDIASNMRGAAYSQGISQAAADSQNRTAAMGNAANAYGQAVNSGGALSESGANQTYNNLGQQSAAGGVLQSNQQGQDTAAQQAWMDNDTRDQSLLNNYYGTIGANNWGKSGTTTEVSKSNPGILGAAMGLGSLAASFAAPGSGALMGGMGGGGLMSSLGGGAALGLNSSLSPITPFKLPRIG